MTDIKNYTYRVGWSDADQEFVATVDEFPSLSWLSDLRNDALTGLINMVANCIASCGENLPRYKVLPGLKQSRSYALTQASMFRRIGERVESLDWEILPGKFVAKYVKTKNVDE